jgi:hypothetical protein
MTQKIPLQPSTKYVLDLSVRSKTSNARLEVYMCPRLILYGKGDQPECIHFSFPVQPDDAWTAHQVSFDSGRVGSQGVFGWPITFLLHNDIEGSVVDVTDLRLSDGGPNVIATGTFAAGGDRWITIDDIQHMPFHIKNLYLEIFFEAGAVGLCVFLAVLTIAFTRAVRAARRQEALGIGIAGSLVAFALVGIVGSLLDNPRPATLFFIFFFWALQPALRRRGQREAYSGGASATATIALS